MGVMGVCVCVCGWVIIICFSTSARNEIGGAGFIRARVRSTSARTFQPPPISFRSTSIERIFIALHLPAHNVEMKIIAIIAGNLVSRAGCIRNFISRAGCIRNDFGFYFPCLLFCKKSQRQTACASACLCVRNMSRKPTCCSTLKETHIIRNFCTDDTIAIFRILKFNQPWPWFLLSTCSWLREQKIEKLWKAVHWNFQNWEQVLLLVLRLFWLQFVLRKVRLAK